MAPGNNPKASTAIEPLSNPLADYFWIAGVDGPEILDIFVRLGEEYKANRPQQTQPVTDTIQEDADAEEDNGAPADKVSSSSQRDSRQFLSNPSNEARLSFRSMESDNKEALSNRSSMTIKGTQSPKSGGLLSDADFNDALTKFASERDSFLNDLSLSAGAVVQNRPKPRPKTQKIVAAEEVNPLKSGIGSVRRHMSFREMNSVKRQPSMARQCEYTFSVLSLFTLYKSLAFLIVLLMMDSFHSNVETAEQLQFGYSCSATP